MATDEVEPQSPHQDKDNWEPNVGMEFDSYDQAFEFYNEYAGRKGFSVRKSASHKNKEDVVVDRRYVCSREGYRRYDRRRENVKNPRPLTRTGCLAGIWLQLQSNGKCKVTKFESVHNHVNVPLSEAHMLRSQRKKVKASTAQGDSGNESSGATKKNSEQSEQGGGQVYLEDLRIGVKNYLPHKRQKVMEIGVAGAIVEYFKKMHYKSPSSFFSMQFDVDDQLTNIFWIDARSIVDYGHFGDVVIFDTTYRVNNFVRPFGLFLGVNHHNQAVVYGATLLYDETVESFIWLFETFLSGMFGKKPKTILTDQSEAIEKAISIVLPDTNHRLCTWHIIQTAAKHLPHIYNSVTSFKSDFNRCVYQCEDVEDFLKAWDNMLETYNLKEDEWLQDLFVEREKWAQVYGRCAFCANLKVTQRSEAFNALLQRHLCSKLDPIHFLEHFERAVEEHRYGELKEDFKMVTTTPVLFLELPILEQMARLYTPNLFQIFHEECKLAFTHKAHFVEKEGSVILYSVAGKNTRNHIVRYNETDCSFWCSCYMFEFTGVQCSHVLKILNVLNIDFLPPQYILKRWTMDAKKGDIKDNSRSVIDVDAQAAIGRRYADLCHTMVKIAAKAAETEESYLHLTCSNVKVMGEVEEIVRNISLVEPSRSAEEAVASQNW
ncbi:protein FAR1-RELATED SEQUENCE 5-like [Aristolochia californica]|uniref:protein FAR1-RELATED SEQUENCE 5-like n=1 Tax=Aristolochia californica TaxID=171875 RepID=UPI0035DA1D84